MSGRAEQITGADPAAARAVSRPAVLVVGCGYVGTALARRLMPDHSVHGLRRSTADLPAGVIALARDIGQPFTLPSAPRFDHVFYLVGADGRSPEAYRQAYETGPMQLLAALAAAGQRPRRLVYASSTSVYGQAAGETVDECSPTEPTSFAGRSVLAGEQRFAASGLPVTRVRFAGIYGPGRSGFVRGVLDGSIGVTDPDRCANRIHVDDCAGILGYLIGAVSPPDVVVASEPTAASRNDAIRWIARQVQRARAPEPEPVADPGSSPGRRRPGEKRCHPTWLLANGYRFGHPDFRSGYGALIDEVLQEPAR